MNVAYHLLLVEDSSDDAELLLHALRDAPFKFTSVRVETEAEYLAALAAPLPDVILCDYHLPRFSSERALQILRQRYLDIPFIVVSHHIGEDAAVAAMQKGASDYLLKNRLGRLSKAIEAAIDRRNLSEQTAIAAMALRTSEAMKRGILNSLNTRIAVVDGKGVIVATNKAWEMFGDARSQSYRAPATLGTNYLSLLQAAADGGNVDAARGLDSLRAVMNRETSLASVEYEISESGSAHWFVARAMPLEDSADGAVISHEDVTDRMLAHRALGDANKRLQVLSKRVLSIQEAERRDISRELHDDIGQSLTALKICMHRLEQRVNDEHKELIADCLAMADGTLNRLRNLSLALRPPQLDQLGLEDALKWLADQQHSATGLEIECKFAGMTERLPAGLEGACYRITQEALNNATRHAKAKKIRVEVERNDRLLTLKIRDDGKGFDMDMARVRAMKTGSLGLISMEERAQLAGGRLQIKSNPGAGTKVIATFVIETPTPRNTDGDSEQNSAGSA